MVNIFAFRSAGSVGQEQLFSTSFGSRKCTLLTQGAFRHIKMAEQKRKITFNLNMKLLLSASVTKNNSVGNGALMKFFKYFIFIRPFSFSICLLVGKVDW